MNKKRVLCMLMAATMTVGALAGCGDSDKGESKGGDDSAKGEATVYERDENGLPDLKGEKFTIWHAMVPSNAQVTSDLGDYKAIQELEKKLNCEIEFVHPPVGQE